MIAGDVYVLPASFAQERLWLLHELAPASPAYHLATALRLRGPLDVDLLRRCVREVVRRHESLRTTFGLGETGALVQLVHGDPAVEVPVRDLSGGPDAGAEAARLSARLAAAPFDLARGPLLRAELFRLAPAEHRLVFVAHHIVVDGASMAVLFNELGAFYRAGLTGGGEPLPELPVQYADWAVWQREAVARAEAGDAMAHWRAALCGAAPVELPTDRPRPPLPRMRGAHLPVRLPDALGERLRGYAAARRATPFMVLTAGLALVLSRWSRQDDLVIGTPVAGRNVRESEPLVGCFVNTLPLRVDVGAAGTFRDLLDGVRQTCLNGYARQEIPFERLVGLANPGRSAGRTPLVSTMLAMRELPEPVWPGVPDLSIEAVAVPTGGAQLDLTLYLNRAGRGYAGELVYDLDLFDEGTVAALAGTLRTALERVLAEPEAPLRRISVLPAAMRRRLLGELSGADQAPVDTGLLHAAVARQAAVRPDAVAVSDEAGSLSFKDLDRRANRLAHALRSRGIGRGDLVGVCLPRGVPVVVALLAVLKAGAAYLPLDAGYPVARLEFMLADSGARAVLVDAGTAPLFPSAPTIDAGADTSGFPDSCPESGVTPRDLAYVIYTSGSTGRPKGAQNEHRGVTNRIAWMQREYRLRPGESVLHKTPLSFDVSGWEVHWPLAAGGHLVLARPGGHRDPEYLAEVICRERVSTVHFVPSMLRAFLTAPGAPRCAAVLRRILCSGEELPRELVRRCARVLPEVALHNLYGPTEAAIDVTAGRVDTGAGGRVPIGTPIPGAHVYVLDPAGEIAPLGAPGELYLGGVAVGRGYHRRPGLTARMFVPDPAGTGARLYRTGDLVRMRPDGALEFLGRLDGQVKIRGQRVETGEVEAVLAEHPAVAAVAVVARPDRDGGARLVGYLVPSTGTGLPGGAQAEPVFGGAEHPQRLPGGLRGYLRGRLPESMVPDVLVPLAELPLTPSGKLDRSRLPAPEPAAARPDRPPAAPSGWAEEALARIWAETLGLDQVGVEDDFYDVGGDSLRAVGVLVRAREAGLAVPMSLLLANHTIRDLARACTVGVSPDG
jgi:amino acid adenylation domain-containing protein